MLGQQIIDALKGHETKSVMVKSNDLQFSPDFTHHEIEKVNVEKVKFREHPDGPVMATDECVVIHINT